ncbi:MAG: NAD(P)H-hydrate epimerase [Anaerolineae bacterium]
MTTGRFRTEQGLSVTAITAAQMREVDRVAMEDFDLGILQMMENAGRNLAENVIDMVGGTRGEIVVLAGGGGNGGGGLCCARHLHNRGFLVEVALDRNVGALKGAAAAQWRILQAAGFESLTPDDAAPALGRADLVIDAVIGYSLRGTPRGRAAKLIALCNEHAARVLALDVPSGLDATSGETPGLAVRAERTLTLALPKTGLFSIWGDLYLADIGIPPEVYEQLGVAYEPPFRAHYWLKLERDTGFQKVP